MRPPVPITVAAGSGLPGETNVTVGLPISVVDRFGPSTAVGRNSVTVPPTSTESPTLDGRRGCW